MTINIFAGKLNTLLFRGRGIWLTKMELSRGILPKPAGY